MVANGFPVPGEEVRPARAAKPAKAAGGHGLSSIPEAKEVGHWQDTATDVLSMFKKPFGESKHGGSRHREGPWDLDNPKQF